MIDKHNIPTVLVIFGATGDLMVKKIVPALFNLYCKNKLPQMFQIVGFSRRDLSQDKFKEHVLSILKNHKGVTFNREKAEQFVKRVLYQRGDFNNRGEYNNLAKVLGRIDGEWKVCSNKLFYLAVPPKYYKTIFEFLHSSGLTIPCSPEEGWTRVIVEKPFGKDQKTAEDLDLLLAKLFKEEQIYRIDHYLAKEMLQNILTFRFSNNLLEPSWNNQYIERIDVRMVETLGVEGRGSFYDGVGALRDVGQNHLLQMLAIVCMDHPRQFETAAIRKKREEFLQTLTPLSRKEIATTIYRAQYAGYQQVEGVAPDSQTETYFKLQTILTSPRWQGVIFTLESGKKFPKAVKDVTITFKHPRPCLCPPGLLHHFQNKITFSLEPKEEIIIDFHAKKPGLDLEIGPRSFNFLYRNKDHTAQYVEEYEKLLMDCILGNQLLFLSTKEVRAMWRFIDPMIEEWEKGSIPLHTYKSSSTDISAAADKALQAIETTKLPKEIAIVGLGKMGANLSRRLLQLDWKVIGYNRTPDDTKLLEKEGVAGTYSLEKVADMTKGPRIIWMMLPAGKAVDEVLFGDDGLVKFLEPGDIIIDSGNSYYKHSIDRAKKLESHNIEFVDIGFSGGPAGALYGGCLMVGGNKKTYEYLLPLFLDIAQPQGVMFFEGTGAGHFVKMIHNGIEYGMMQALGEGFHILKESGYKLNLEKVADIYNHGSVIESRLVGWLQNALDIYGQELKNISPVVRHTGEAAWTLLAAKELMVKAKVIEDALEFRKQSEKNPSFTGRVLSALRNQFGGHAVK